MNTVIFGDRPFEAELIIFDKDGTLTDFKKTWLPILETRLDILTEKLHLQEKKEALRNTAYRRFGITGQQIDPYGPFPHTPPHEDEVIFATVLYEFGIPYEKAKMAARSSVIEAEALINRIDISVLYDGVEDVLRKLHAGGVLLTLATADLTEYASETLKHLGIFDLFDYVVGADMVTNNKPHPEMVEKTAEALGVSSLKTALVGDSIVDMEMGKTAGLGLTVGVTESGIASVKDLSSQADIVIHSIRDIRVMQG
jgi:phosphoglycolate phosphatase